VSLPDGTRALRTGDLGRVHHGQLEVLGRLDGRVKVRGNAVDTLEVEHALTALDEVLDAAVTPVTTADGTTRLVAHVQLIPVDPPTVGALRRELARTLPTFAVPSRVVIVSHVPRTPRGKVDRAALREQSLVVTPREAPVAAGDALEAEVIAHFEEILGLEGVGATDDFFELGGDSLDAVELVLALEQDSKVRLLPTQLLASATPRALAVALRDGPTRPSTVLPLTFGRPGRIPLVCLAGGPGQALAMLPLANRLGSRAVYGVQSRGLEGREPFDRTIEARASTHIADLRRVQPTGPYFLGGHSLGGMVAFEMMRQLRAAGERVPLLVLLDADSSAGRNGGALDGMGRVLRDLYPGDGLRARSKRGVRLVYIWARRRSAAAISRFRRLGVIRRREALHQINANLARKYRPVPAPGPALLVRVHSEDEPWRLARPRDLGWEGIVTSDLAITMVPAHHVEMVREPEVAEVARVVAAALDAIDPPAH
jgi:thioesterase domain-containing protein/acyl carrier protein